MDIVLADTRSLPDAVLDAFRFRAIAAHQAGFTETDIAAILGVRQETVSRWWLAYQQSGLDGLPHERMGRPVGSGRTLSPEQEQRLQEEILHHYPEQLGIPAALWTRKAVRELIRCLFGLSVPIRTVGLYLQRWGWTPKRPARKGYRQNPAEVRHWLKVLYPKIKARAKREGAAIHWGDETGIDADASPARGYAPGGQTPQRQVTGGHVRTNLISTITNEGKVRFMVYTETMTSLLFIEFLRRLLRGATRKIFLIVDRLPAHVGAEVDEWVARHSEQIEVFYLPRHSPELNPDERLNNNMKETVNEEGLAKSKKELQGRVRRWLHRLAKLPERVINYFASKPVAYAAAMS